MVQLLGQNSMVHLFLAHENQHEHEASTFGTHQVFVEIQPALSMPSLCSSQIDSD